MSSLIELAMAKKIFENREWLDNDQKETLIDIIEKEITYVEKRIEALGNESNRINDIESKRLGAFMTGKEIRQFFEKRNVAICGYRQRNNYGRK